MTTTTIERAKLEEWLDRFQSSIHAGDTSLAALEAEQMFRAALLAPATAPEPRYSLVPMGEPPHQSKAWIAPLSGKVSAIPVEGFVMLDKDMREGAQARKMHACWAGGWVIKEFSARFEIE